MGIFILLLSGYLFYCRIRKESNRTQLMLWGAAGVYFIFSLILNWYLREVYRWPHGIPGSDLQMHYDGAVALSQGKSLSELVQISSSYEISFLHLGYLAYVLFIYLTVLSPVIIDLEISLQILYCVQGFVAIVSALNIADFFNDKNDKKTRNWVLWMLLLCTSFLQMAAILMRDIWIIFLITCLLNECKKKNSSLIKCVVYIVLALVSRYYSVAITLPILLGYKYNKKLIATIGSLVMFAAFFVGQEIINRMAVYVGIQWIYQFHFTIPDIVSFILFPSPINQAENVQHMNTGFQAIFGGNTEWVYYLLSCWNVYVFPVSAFGIYRSIRDGEAKDAALWGMLIINIAMLMCLFYQGVSSPRHKLLIVISLAYFFKKGIDSMKFRTKALYFFLITIILIAVFALV